MSTDLTPALARAAEAASHTMTREISGRLPRGPWAEESTAHRDAWTRIARDAVSAALHDPDGALARTLCRRIHRSLWPVASAPDPDRPGCANCREHVSVLRAAILGEA